MRPSWPLSRCVHHGSRGAELSSLARHSHSVVAAVQPSKCSLDSSADTVTSVRRCRSPELSLYVLVEGDEVAEANNRAREERAKVVAKQTKQAERQEQRSQPFIASTPRSALGVISNSGTHTTTSYQQQRAAASASTAVDIDFNFRLRLGKDKGLCARVGTFNVPAKIDTPMLGTLLHLELCPFYPSHEFRCQNGSPASCQRVEPRTI